MHYHPQKHSKALILNIKKNQKNTFKIFKQKFPKEFLKKPTNFWNIKFLHENPHTTN
jgi:hypothetical protein